MKELTREERERIRHIIAQIPARIDAALLYDLFERYKAENARLKVALEQMRDTCPACGGTGEIRIERYENHPGIEYYPAHCQRCKVARVALKEEADG